MDSLEVFFFNDPATTEIYTLSLHDALPIYRVALPDDLVAGARDRLDDRRQLVAHRAVAHPRDERHAPVDLQRVRSEEYTSELQSRQYLVCRLLLEKKKPDLHRSLPTLFDLA